MPTDVSNELIKQLDKNELYYSKADKILKVVIWSSFSVCLALYLTLIYFIVQDGPQFFNNNFYFLLNSVASILVLAFASRNIFTSIGKIKMMNLISQDQECRNSESTMFVINERIKHSRINLIAHFSLIGVVICFMEVLFRHSNEAATVENFVNQPSLVIGSVLLVSFTVFYIIHLILKKRLEDALFIAQLEL